MEALLPASTGLVSSGNGIQHVYISPNLYS